MHELVRNTWIIAKREFVAYFSTPLATVFLIIFIALTGAFAFYVGGFFERGQADLAPFFQYHPWLYLLLVPAVAMRLWAEERKSGTIELLMTLPISPWEAILGKFFAAWGFIGVALLLTLPMWITVNVLGSPDNGVILAGYVGSFLMAGAFLAIGSCISALTTQPGDRLHRLLGHLLPAGHERARAGAQRAARLDARLRRDGGVVDELPVPLRPHHQGRARSLGHRFLPVADRLRPVRQPHLRRAEESRLREDRRAQLSRHGSASCCCRLPIGWSTKCARLPRHTLAWASIALALILLLSVNLFAGSALRNAKADLTQQRLFTISGGTRTMLRAIDEPISLRLYFSKRLGEAASVYARYFERVRALLQQYSDISGGRLDLAVFDPEPFSDAEDKAVAAGLRGVRLNQDGEVGYFGLVGNNSTDTDANIPFFTTDREAFLEYDLTKLIYTLANPKKRVVGLITSLPLDGGMNPMAMMGGGGRQQLPPQMIMEQIRDFFEVRTLAQDVKEIPADVDVLMVAQPDRLTPEAVYAIDQYVLGGGKLLALVDPVAEMSGRMGPMGMPPSGPSPEFVEAAEGMGGRLRSQQGRRRHRHRAARAVRRRRRARW